jgi:hypothetical protein
MPLDLAAVQLIYQTGGYWVYRIPGGKEPASVGATPEDAASFPAPSLPPASE